MCPLVAKNNVKYMFIKQTAVIFSALCLMITCAHVNAAELSGTVKITEKGSPAKQREYEDVVIYFVPTSPSDVSQMSTGSHEIKMEKKRFLPRVLPVTVGSEVNFPNFDPILHNAFSTSRNNDFDLGVYGGGENASHAFDKSGLVRVYCNVHHAMVAYILVFDNPYFTKLNDNSTFSLNELPDVPGRLFIWHPRAKVIKQKIDFTSTVPNQEFNIELTQRRVPKHKNKEGKSYRKVKERNY